MGHTVRFFESTNKFWRLGGIPAAFLIVWVLCGSSLAIAQEKNIPSDGKQVLESGDSQVPVSSLVVEKSTLEGVSFGYDHLVHHWNKTTQGLQPRERFALEVPGFVSAGSAGSASVPRSGGWIVVPPGTTPELHIVKESWSSAGGRPLAVVTIPVRVGDPTMDDASFSGIAVLPDEQIPEDLPIAPSVLDGFAARKAARTGPAVQLGDVIWWRGRRIVSYSVVPVRYDSQAVATEVLDSGSWEVRFVENKATLKESIPKHHAQKTTNRFDDQFGFGFLNGGLLSGMSTESVWRGLGSSAKSAPDYLEKIRGDKSGTLKGPEVRIPVPASRLYRVAYSTLVDNNFIPAGETILESEVRLYQRRYMAELDDGSGQAPYAEIEVPVHMVGDGGTFAGEDFFIFYGLRNRDDQEFQMEIDGQLATIPGSGDPQEANSDGNFYWLAYATPDVGENWARMETTSLPAATSTPLSSYKRTVHKEEAVAYRGNVPRQTSERIVNNNFWDYDTNVVISPLFSPDPAGGDVDIKISVIGAVDDTIINEFSLTTGNLPTTELGTFSTYNRNEVYFYTTVPISAIAGESTKLAMSSLSYGVFMQMYLNFVELSYDALFKATGNLLEFHGTTQAGPQPMVVTGFENDAMGLIELSNPRQPVFVALSAENIVTDGETVSLSIQPSQLADQRLFYAHGDMLGNGIPNFAYWTAELVSNPVNPTHLAGGVPALVVVTHEEFRDGLAPWIEHRKNRSGGDLEVHVVQTQDLYDWYSGGLHDAWAIKRFASHAINQWGSYALQLVGDGNENMRELGVNAVGRPYAKDWVPTHYHTQGNTGYPPELLAADKWYATFEVGVNYPFDNFPDQVRGPWEMLVGRFPCNSNEELANIIAKIQGMENPQPNQSWRKRAIFFADDAWSNAWGVDGISNFTYKPNEEYFASSARDSLGPWWSEGTGVSMVADTLFLATWLDPHWGPEMGTERPKELFVNYTMDEAYPPLLSSLNNGGLVAHFQGHGSGYLLSSEYWFRDMIAGNGVLNVSDLNNNNRPWVFFGMGCHIADWCRSTVILGTYFKEPSLSEKFLVRANSGSTASYASSGYEYISNNLRFGEAIFKVWTKRPPISRGAGGFMNERSRWVLGEILWTSEAEIMSYLAYDTHYREAVAQFTLLGDPLMVLDGGEPEVTAVLHGIADEEISGSIDLVAFDSSNKRLITIEARDEAGIDRLEIEDSDGNNLGAYVISEAFPRGAQSHQVVIYELEIDVLPYDHSITIKVYDTGASLPGDRHYDLQLNMRQDGEFTSDGELVDPENFVFREGEPVEFSSVVESSAWLNDSMDIHLTGEHLTITNEIFSYDKSNVLEFSFTAEENGPTTEERAVILHIDQYETRFVLSGDAGELAKPEITGVYNYPNPLHDSTRFVYECNSAGGRGRVRIFSMAGRQVTNLGFTFVGNDGGGVVPWDGRDAEGDELGNGTYLYRLELDVPSGQLVSDMQRLVIMR